jgi:hypothetical protein
MLKLVSIWIFYLQKARNKESPTQLELSDQRKLLSKLKKKESKSEDPTLLKSEEDKTKLKIADRIRSKDPAKIFRKHFVDLPRALAYAKKHIWFLQLDAKNKPVDPDFDFQEEEDPEAISQVMDCLVVLAKTAKQLKAAILIPDYMTMSPNSKLIETALDYVEFDGPVISVCTQDQAASDDQTAAETYRVKDNATNFPKGLLLNRATHSIQVRNGSYSRVAARLARVIAQPNKELFDSDGLDNDRPGKAVFVVAGGGAVVMENMAEAVEQNIPIVILQGSKRLCDFLPKLWVQRFSAQFDVLTATHQLCEQCGFKAPTDPDNKMNLWVRTLVDKGHVNIHPLLSGTHSLSRILQSLQTKDDALLQAMRRYCDYRSAARNMESPDYRMLISKLVLGFATTLSVTIAGAVLPEGELQRIVHGKLRMGDVPAPIFLLCVSVVVLPAMLSIMMALQHDYNYTPKILALRYAAALVEQEMFRYRACSAYYSDEKISEAIRKAKSKAGKRDSNKDSGAQQPEDGSDTKDEAQGANIEDSEETSADAFQYIELDIQSTRARRLTEELIKIGEKVPIYDCPDIGEEEQIDELDKMFKMSKTLDSQKSSKERAAKKPKGLKAKVDVHVLIEQMKGLSGVREVAHHTLEEFDSEVKFGQLSGDDYASVRLHVYRERYETEADSLDWVLLFYKVATYGIGAVSGFLSYMGFEVNEWTDPPTRPLAPISRYGIK